MFFEANDDLALPRKPFKVVAVIPVHERLALLPHTIRRLLTKNRVQAVICVGDGLKEKAICMEAGAVWEANQNKPLGAKWNKGYLAAKEHNPDAVLYVGSSDFVSANWIHTMQPYLETYHMVGVPGMHLVDIADRIRLCYWAGYRGERKNETIGIGRMLSRHLLDQIGWQPFDSKKDSSLDRSMKDKAKTVGVTDYFVIDKTIKALSISTDRWENLHKFEQHWNGILPSERILGVHMDQFLNTYFPEVYQVFK